MSWKKLGKVFPGEKESQLTNGKEFAAVPCVLQVSAEITRIFFSRRSEKNKSEIWYADFFISESPKLVDVSKAAVLLPGPVGSFDEAGAMCSWIYRNGSEVWLYYIGWNLGATVPFRNSIGLAISRDDGRSFKKYSQGPILDRSIYDPVFVASSCVLKESNLWRMWYLSAEAWEPIENGDLRCRYNIKYADSSDGIHWKREGRVCIDFQNEAEYAISRASVLKENDGYYMWYSYRGAKYKIGYAVSRDGLAWQRKDNDVGIDISSGGWDSDMIEYPCVFMHNGEKYMLYNGNAFGRTGFGLAVWRDK